MRNENDRINALSKILLAYTKNDIISFIKQRLGSELAEISYRIFLMSHIFNSIHLLFINGQYYPAFILGRSMADGYIDLMFVLKEDTEKRANELIESGNRGEKPFKGVGWELYGTVIDRAKNAELDDFYEKTYRSLCAYTHPSARCFAIFDPAHANNEIHKTRFIKSVIEMFIESLYEVATKYKFDYSEEFNGIICQIKSEMKSWVV